MSEPLIDPTLIPSTIPIWFQYSVYMQNKLAWCKTNNTVQNGVSINTMPKLLDTFKNQDDFENWLKELAKSKWSSEWNAITNESERTKWLKEKSEQLYTPQLAAWFHFVAFGNKATENISPNRWFDCEYYFNSKGHHDGTSYSQAKSDILNAGLSCWRHYCNHGTEEFINPSRWFDTRAYIEAKANVMGTTVEYIVNAIEELKHINIGKDHFAMENALTHCIRYAGDLINPRNNEVTAFIDVTHQALRYPYCSSSDPWYLGTDPYYVYRNGYAHKAFMSDMKVS